MISVVPYETVWLIPQYSEAGKLSVSGLYKTVLLADWTNTHLNISEPHV